MRRQPDNEPVIDAEDSGNFDVRKLREDRGLIYVERSKKPDWLVGLAATLLAGGIFAAWTANARLSSLETQVSDLKEQVMELKRLLEPRYRGGPNEPNAR